ncbi:hypothetical protein DE146DRAFT_613977 [Phaeosphaeria sp. MPI-PUGE-AT-0046c]|nr:hypothetical protein DE146DRAFT_613977 [Phaeosphaeria sp. MPI-PUGE-AT-0046c]
MVANAITPSFEVPQPGVGSTGSRVRFSLTSSPESIPEAPQVNPIRDLRSALRTNSLDCIGFLEAEEHRFVLYPGNRTATISNVSTVSLDELLGGVSDLTRRKRFSLALTLASSYLQLCTTPWLNNYLHKESIVFVRDIAEPQSIQLEHPYIRQEVSRTPGKAATQELSTAIQWSKLVGEEAGPEFAEAIEWCLHAKTLTDSNWRTELWRHVVLPLEASHKHISQKPITA